MPPAHFPHYHSSRSLAKGVTREARPGTDLKREYTDFSSIEITTHRDWCQQHIQTLDLALHLHDDWESQGSYLYELNFKQDPSRSPRLSRLSQATYRSRPRA